MSRILGQGKPGAFALHAAVGGLGAALGGNVAGAMAGTIAGEVATSSVREQGDSRSQVCQGENGPGHEGVGNARVLEEIV